MSKQLNINPEMDEFARDNGLGHWSCVSPKSNKMWVRSDGFEWSWNLTDKNVSWRRELKRRDSLYPVGKDWQQPKQTIEVSDYDINIIRQWFDCIKDCHPKYFDSHDFRLAKKLGFNENNNFHGLDVKKQPTPVSFKKLSLGARFKYIAESSTRTYVKIGGDLIAVWDGNNIDTAFMGQGIFSFSEDGNTDVDVELVG